MRQDSHIADDILSLDNGGKIEDGYAAARAYKYYSQAVRRGVIKIIPESRISAHTLYKEHRGTFDRLVLFFGNASVDPRRYIRFMASEIGISDSDIDRKLMSKRGINMFMARLAAEANREKIYRWYQKTVKTLAESCLDSECVSTADFIRMLIRKKKLAQWVVGGKISAYYLASIPGF